MATYRFQLQIQKQSGTQSVRLMQISDYVFLRNDPKVSDREDWAERLDTRATGYDYALI